MRYWSVRGRISIAPQMGVRLDRPYLRVHMVRIPWGEIAHITGHITLKKPGATYGLLKTEHRFAPIVRKVPYA
jgi:hypothetical protein